MALHNDKWDEFRALLRKWKDEGRVESEQYWEMLYLVEEYGWASELEGLKVRHPGYRRQQVEDNLRAKGVVITND